MGSAIHQVAAEKLLQDQLLPRRSDVNLRISIWNENRTSSRNGPLIFSSFWQLLTPVENAITWIPKTKLSSWLICQLEKLNLFLAKFRENVFISNFSERKICNFGQKNWKHLVGSLLIFEALLSFSKASSQRMLLRTVKIFLLISAKSP